MERLTLTIYWSSSGDYGQCTKMNLFPALSANKKQTLEVEVELQYGPNKNGDQTLPSSS